METHPDVLSCDLSQRIDRISVGRDGEFPTLTPESKHWLRQVGTDQPRYHNRLLLGREILCAQGYPVEWLKDDVSDPLLSDLGGNAMTAQVVLSVLIGCLMHHHGAQAPSEHDDLDAIADLITF